MKNPTLYLQSLSTVLCVFTLLALPLPAAAQPSETVRYGLHQNKPLNFTGENGAPQGLVIDIFAHIAAEQKLDVEYVPCEWSACLQMLERGDIDVFSAIGHTPERETLFDFTENPVITNWGLIVTGPRSGIDSILDLEGKRIAVLEDAGHTRALQGLLGDFNIEAQFIEVRSFAEVFEQVRSKRADAGVVNRLQAAEFRQDNLIHQSSIIFNPVEIRYAFTQGKHAELLQRINDRLLALRNEPGSIFHRSLEHWMGKQTATGLPKWLKWASIFSALTIFALVSFSALLKVQIRSKTRKLQQEISERKETESRLIRSEEQLRLIFENAPVSLWREDFSSVKDYVETLRQKGVVDFRLYFDAHPEVVAHCASLVKIIDVNRASLTLHRARSKDQLLNSLSSTFTPESFSAFREGLIHLIEGIRSFETEAVIQTLDGEKRNVLLQMFVDPQGTNCDTVYIALTDITQLKQVEDKLIENDRIKSEFISTASHELRTPLTVVRGYVELLLENDSFPPKQRREFLGHVLDKSTVLERMINELLDISCIETDRSLSLEKTSICIAEVVKLVLNQLTLEHRQHRFSTYFPEDQIELMADRGRMVQVFENIIGNAIKFSPKGGEISIQGEKLFDKYRIRVIDQGIGMDRKAQKNVFEKFFRVDASNTAVPGLGIGLPLVKNIIEAHEGEVWMASEKGQGTEFFFTLPL